MIEIKREQPVPRYSDPEEPLAGRCMTCKTVVGCLRMDAVPGGRAELGAWNDLLAAGCPRCGARVFLMPAKEFEKTVSKEE